MRKSGKDYKKEYKEAIKTITSIQAHVKDRLEFLVKTYPEALVYKKNRDEIHCKVITQAWLDRLDTETRISYIEGIEKWLSQQGEYKQTEIKY